MCRPPSNPSQQSVTLWLHRPQQGRLQSFSTRLQRRANTFASSATVPTKTWLPWRTIWGTNMEGLWWFLARNAEQCLRTARHWTVTWSGRLIVALFQKFSSVPAVWELTLIRCCPFFLHWFECLGMSLYKYEIKYLGATVGPNMDVFLENFQTALPPPPPSFFGNYIALFSRKFVKYA